jgi:hypothetical protein
MTAKTSVNAIALRIESKEKTIFESLLLSAN